MMFLDPVCRMYQSFFAHNHPEAANLVTLHHEGRQTDYLRAYFDHEYEKGVHVLERFDRFLPGRQHGQSLDFGCGAGGLTYRIAERSERTTGIDLDAEKIAFGRVQSLRVNQQNVDLMAYDGGAIPLEDNLFDTIFCVDVVEHLPTPERFIGEFLRLLKPGGILFLSFGPPWCHAHGKHMWARLPGWWSHLLFPRSTCMRVSGFDPRTTWEDLGMFRLTVRHFERIMALSGFEVVHQRAMIGPKMLRPIQRVPFLRELFVGECEGVYRKAG